MKLTVNPQVNIPNIQPITTINYQPIYDNTYQALKLLIENCYHGQLIATIELHRGNNIQYFKEFCTIKLTASRRSGHSTAICKTIKEYFNKAIILSPSATMSKRDHQIMEKTLNEKCTKITQTEILTKNDQYLFYSYTWTDFTNYLRGIDTEAIFIDGTFNLTNKQIEEIYRVGGACMSNYPQKFFVFVE